MESKAGRANVRVSRRSCVAKHQLWVDLCGTAVSVVSSRNGRPLHGWHSRGIQGTASIREWNVATRDSGSGGALPSRRLCSSLIRLSCPNSIATHLFALHTWADTEACWRSL